MAYHVFRKEDLDQLEQRFRAQLINSCGGFRQPILIGTADPDGHTNLAVFTSIFHVGANPPLLGMVVRPDSVARHTLENLMETQCYTLNWVHESIYKQAHQTSARFPREQSEFEATGLTPMYQEGIHAPFVKESHLHLGMKPVQKINLELNGTLIIIGEVIFFGTDEQYITEDGWIDHHKAKHVAVTGLDAYYTAELLERLPYAKP